MKLPTEIINHILTYDRRFILRDRKLVQINRICIPELDIPPKEFDLDYLYVSVYLPITVNKFYYFQCYGEELRLYKMESEEEDNMTIDEYVYTAHPRVIKQYVF